MNEELKKPVNATIVYKLVWDGSAANGHQSGHMYFVTEEAALRASSSAPSRFAITPVTIPRGKLALLQFLNAETKARMPEG